MIYSFTKQLAALLKAQGVPFPVVFGAEPTDPVAASRERIVVEQVHDEKPDTFGGPMALHSNPPMPRVRSVGIRFRVFARANLAGAAWHDHAERAEHAVDEIIAETDYMARAERTQVSFDRGGFVTPKDENGTLVWSGAVYEFDAKIDRGIFRRSWAGDAAEEVVIGPPPDVGITSTTKVSTAPGYAGTPPNDAETVPGPGGIHG